MKNFSSWNMRPCLKTKQQLYNKHIYVYKHDSERGSVSKILYIYMYIIYKNWRLDFNNYSISWMYIN